MQRTFENNSKYIEAYLRAGRGVWGAGWTGKKDIEKFRFEKFSTKSQKSTYSWNFGKFSDKNGKNHTLNWRISGLQPPPFSQKFSSVHLRLEESDRYLNSSLIFEIERVLILFNIIFMRANFHCRQSCFLFDFLTWTIFPRIHVNRQRVSINSFRRSEPNINEWLLSVLCSRPTGNSNKNQVEGVVKINKLNIELITVLKIVL